MSAGTVSDGLPLDRREWLKRAAVGGGLAAAALATPAFTGVADAKGGKRIMLDVDTNGFADFDFSGSDGGATGAFYVSGVIMAPDTTDEIGQFHCWGWIRGDGLGLITQEFHIDGRGSILVAGVESDVPRAVTGGTGNFRNARGQGMPDLAIFDFNNSGKFRITFRLTGASGPPIR